MPRVLIIDDHDTMREGMCVTVKKSGCDAFAVRSGPEGLEAYRKSPFDLVITDLKMQQMDGIEVVRQIKQLDPDAVVMVVTGFGTIETAVAAMQQGAYDFITKPVHPGGAAGQSRAGAAARWDSPSAATGERAQRGALGRRSGGRRLVDRTQRTDAAAGGTGAQGRQQRRHGVDSGGDRHGKGAGGAPGPRAVTKEKGSLRGGALRGARRNLARERIVRTRARKLHWRLAKKAGSIRVGGPGLAVSRRDWRNLTGDPDQAAAGAAGKGAAKSRWRADHPRRRSGDLRHQPGSQCRSAERAISRGPVLPVACGAAASAAASGPFRGHSAAGRAFRRQTRAADQPQGQGPEQGLGEIADSLRLARKRPRVGEPDRTGPGLRRGRTDRGLGFTALSKARAAGRANRPSAGVAGRS